MRLRTLLLSAVLVMLLTTRALAIDPALSRDLADGKIDNPCKYSSATLQKTLNTLGADDDQYYPDIRANLNAALRAHASGQCDPKPSPTPTAAVSPTPTAAVTATPTVAAGVPGPSGGPTGGGTKQVVDAPPEPAAPQVLGANAPVATTDPRLTGALLRPPSNGIPDVLAVLLVVLGVLAVLGGVFMGARRFGRAEGPMSDTRHAWREAAWRFIGGWETFRDWVRAGR